MPASFDLSRATRLLLSLAAPLLVFAPDSSAAPRLVVEADTVLRELDRHRLLGTNLALWHPRDQINSPRVKPLLDLWSPAMIRLPGGSWSNEFYWNGHGVRRADGSLDLSKRRPDGTWEVDYSGYAPGFRVEGDDRHPAPYQGTLHVLEQHEFVKRMGAEPFVTVNFGSGDARMAAEWARFAKDRGYGVRYWEVGNELNGQWEMGHRLPGGGVITGRLYAERFKEYAAAIKAVDPRARVGGPASSDLSAAFTEELLEIAGDQVDFVSVHAYPVGVQLTDPAAKFARLDELATGLNRIKTWIRRHQPARADAIELGVTEWNIKVNEDRDTGDILGGLWASAWIGEMFREGVHFAHQWDLFTSKEKGGHGVFRPKGDTLEPKATYWANYVWSRLMADRLLASRLEDAPSAAVRAYATASSRGLHILLVNGAETPVAGLALDLRSSRPLAATGRVHTLSRRTYFWNPHAHVPVWSLPPETSDIALGSALRLDLPASSALVLELPWRGEQAAAALPASRETRPALRLVLPDSATNDLPVEGWLLALDAETGRPWRGALPAASLEVSGPATADRVSLAFEQSVARFTLAPGAAGSVRVSASAGAARAEHALAFTPVQQRDLVLYTFDNPLADWKARSHFTLRSQSSVRPNQAVAEIVLNNALPAENADNLVHFEPLPASLPRKSICGLVAQLRASPDLRCADPKARVNFILQSEADHWIPLGGVPLSDLLQRWQNVRLAITDPRLLEAMGKLYSVRLQLQSSAPVTGAIHLDDLGFVLRTTP